MEALASALDAQSRRDVSVLAPLRLEAGSTVCGVEPTAQPVIKDRHSSMKILLACWAAGRATLSPGPTPPSAGFQVPLLRWGGTGVSCV